MVRKALVRHDGLVAQAAHTLKITRQALHERIGNSAEFQDLVLDLRTSHGDLAESVLTYRMKRFKDREAAKFILSTRFKDRGYGPQPEIPPPPPDNSRRQVVIQNIVMMLGDRAAAVHAQPVDITPPGALNGHAKPAVKPNGHIAGPAAAQLLAAKKGNGKV